MRMSARILETAQTPYLGLNESIGILQHPTQEVLVHGSGVNTLNVQCASLDITSLIQAF